MSTILPPRRILVSSLSIVCLMLSSSLFAQPLALRIAVLDVQRILVESEPGRKAIEDLKVLQEESVATARTRQEDVKVLQDKINEGRLSLSADRLAEMEKQLEAKVLDFRRFQEDMERELNRKRDEAFAKIERDVMPIVDEVGKAEGYTLIFNKFQSGLVYADQQVDITDAVIVKYNEKSGQ